MLKFSQALLVLFSNLTLLFPALPGCLKGVYPSVGQKLHYCSLDVFRTPNVIVSLFPSRFLISLTGTGIFWAGRLWASHLLLLMLFPTLPNPQICRSSVGCRVILSISDHHPLSQGLHNLSRVTAITLSQIKPHSDCSFHQEYFQVSEVLPSFMFFLNA